MRRDIRIDSEQKIKEGLEVLRQSGKLPMGQAPDYFRSRLNQKPVSAYKTFAEENVYDGDILTVIVNSMRNNPGGGMLSAAADGVLTDRLD